MPTSTSFPSGHAASAFAFAYAVGRRIPALAVPIRLLAAGVAYSRVHTGVHYPGDVWSAPSSGPERRLWSRLSVIASGPLRPGMRRVPSLQ